jgi:hypothetical protein
VPELVVDPRFNGPPGSGNGGYTCGLVARLLDGPAEVTLRRPPPLGRPLRVESADGRVEVRDGDELVAEAVPAHVDLDVPEPVSVADAEAASRGYPGFERHAFPTCFVCGPERAPGDGLRIFASPLDGIVAAPWTPVETGPELVWAVLDCPGAYALEWEGRSEILLGRLHGRVDRVPARGERCVVVGWPLGWEGRKGYAGTAVFSDDRGDLLARARATWIEPRGQ